MSRVGNKIHLGTVKKMVKDKDTGGGKVKKWEHYVNAWFSLTPIKGTERWYSHEKHATATHQLVMWYRPGVNTKMRVVLGDRIFEIVSALNIGERDKELMLIVEEDVDHD